MRYKYDCVDALRAAGIAYDDATALRRIRIAASGSTVDCSYNRGVAVCK